MYLSYILHEPFIGLSWLIQSGAKMNQQRARRFRAAQVLSRFLNNSNSSNLLVMASILLAMAFILLATSSDGLQPDSNGLQPNDAFACFCSSPGNCSSIFWKERVGLWRSEKRWNASKKNFGKTGRHRAWYFPRKNLECPWMQAEGRTLPNRTSGKVFDSNVAGSACLKLEWWRNIAEIDWLGCAQVITPGTNFLHKMSEVKAASKPLQCIVLHSRKCCPQAIRYYIHDRARLIAMQVKQIDVDKKSHMWASACQVQRMILFGKS